MVQASGKRLWLRVADPRTEKRKLSAISAEFIKFWMRWAICTPRLRALRSPPLASPASIAADAMASGSTVGIGGFASLSSSGPLLWFSEIFDVQEFLALGLQMQLQAQRDITCYEILAQHALLCLVAARLPTGRLHLQLPTLSDNTGSESSVIKLFSTVYPICMFLQRIAAFSTLSGLSLEVAHVPGVCNDDADMLSRWDGVSPLAPKWLLQNRVRLPLAKLWYFRSDVKLWPEAVPLAVRGRFGFPRVRIHRENTSAQMPKSRDLSFGLVAGVVLTALVLRSADDSPKRLII
ncbi:hypothetical protein AK812_SmicGene19051 [Symbiodinium microadriaticum]|uniref:Uncharacterized protein n=1 Tax=Symbiodinium microadriaticum TaxID=2951 RepID=A0A1Q9DTK4_SYMMI|nr:hypothetical protein AK812_SmicGene19051 [Symbiodinium microadriaticum]CAE7268687.1 unnamed protein product [Symbiodinium sp. KB8]